MGCWSSFRALTRPLGAAGAPSAERQDQVQTSLPVLAPELSAYRRPPRAATALALQCRPSPDPRCLVEKRRSKIRCRCPASMPAPLSSNIRCDGGASLVPTRSAQHRDATARDALAPDRLRRVQDQVSDDLLDLDARAAHGAGPGARRVDLDRRDRLQLGAEPVGGLSDHLVHAPRLEHPAGAAVALLLAEDLLDVLDLDADAAHVVAGVAHQRRRVADRRAGRSAADRPRAALAGRSALELVDARSSRRSART